MKKKSRKTKEFLNFTNEEMGVIIKRIFNYTLGQLACGYVDNSMDENGGIFAWNGKLNIRPPFQRAYVVDAKQDWKTKLISSIIHDKPIGCIYFGQQNTDVDYYMLLDGQQRLITVFEFINNLSTMPVMKDGKVKECLFSQLTQEEQNKILNYKPTIYVATGSQSAILEWFITINQQITILTDQEIRNAAFNGPFVESAKRYFCRVRATQKPTSYNYLVMHQDSDYSYLKYTNCKSPESCDVLEVALDWLTYEEYPEMRVDNTMDERIRRYMSEHANDDNADDLLNHYKTVYDWVRNTFTCWQKSMKKVDWGRLYTEYHNKDYDINDLNMKVDEYMNNEEVTANSAVFEFVLLGCPENKVNMLIPRNFKERQKQKQYQLQGGLDPVTMEPLLTGKGKKHYVAHHIIPFYVGGKTDESNIVLINPETHALIHDGCEYSPEKIKILRDHLMQLIANNNKK